MTQGFPHRRQVRRQRVADAGALVIGQRHRPMFAFAAAGRERVHPGAEGDDAAVHGGVIGKEEGAEFSLLLACDRQEDDGTSGYRLLTCECVGDFD